MSAMDRVNGDIEQRLPQLATTGVESEYRAIFTSYADLLTDPGQHTEALKRAVFLSWYAYAEPGWLSGVGGLPTVALRRVMLALEKALDEPLPDPELIAMLK